MRTVLRTLAALAVIGILGAAAVVGFGLYNVSARQGHLPGVGWVLHTTFQQSVHLRAPSQQEVPDDLDDPDRIKLGALHFKTACAFCHAVPGQIQTATARAMNPPPPHISEAVTQWEPAEMMWIVREGVKMSGMPHWPAEGRADEIWSVVAYLQAVDDMTAEEQIALAGNETGPASCTACHGENGRSGNSFIPRLDILTQDQVGAALRQYRAGVRASGIMEEAAARLTDAQITALSEKFGLAEVPLTVAMSDDQSEGAQLATRGTRDVPACTACHGPGRSADAPIAPMLAGQGRAYLENQLRVWRDEPRGGGPRTELMRKAAQGLTDAQIKTLAAWYAGAAPD